VSAWLAEGWAGMGRHGMSVWDGLRSDE